MKFSGSEQEDTQANSKVASHIVTMSVLWSTKGGFSDEMPLGVNTSSLKS